MRLLIKDNMLKINLIIIGLILLAFSCSSLNLFQDDVINIQKIEYTSHDGHNLKADVYSKKGFEQKNVPTVIVIHGGGWRNRTGDMVDICKKIALEGYKAINITYRLAPLAHYPTQLYDVKAIMYWIQKNSNKYHIDQNNLFVWGYSAGAHLAFLLANESDVSVNAVVIGGTPTYLPGYPKSDMIIDLMGTKYEDNKQGWEDASPLVKVSEKTPPTFIYHGEYDMLVGIDQSEMLARQLKLKERPYEFYRVPMMGHLAVYSFSDESEKRSLEFINRYIKTTSLSAKDEPQR